MDFMIWLWLGAIVLFGVAELITEGMVSIWFLAGAAAALFSCIANLSLGGLGTTGTQVLVFAVVSAAALAASRPLVRKIMNKPGVPANLDRIVGAVARVTESIDNERASGAVYVDGKTWSARSAEGDVIPAGARVKIQRIEGVKLLVNLMERTEAVK